MPESLEEFEPQSTADGSYTFYSSAFGEAFHSQYGARQEAEKKFVEPTQLKEKAQQPQLRLLDVCYGLGYNTAAALATIWQVNPRCRVEVVALEANPMVPAAAIAHRLLDGWCEPIPQLLAQFARDEQLQTDCFKATLLIGDARTTIRQVEQTSFQADAIFLDPFSPPHCPQLWTVEFLQHVARCLATNGRLATYSCAAAVRSALLETGLKIGSTSPVGRRSPGTVAAWQAVLPPLSLQEQNHLLTRAAIFYRDPLLSDSADVILQRRHQEQNASSLISTSQWRRALNS